MNTTEATRFSAHTTTSCKVQTKSIADTVVYEDLNRLLAITQGKLDQLIAAGLCPDTHGDQCEND